MYIWAYFTLPSIIDSTRSIEWTQYYIESVSWNLPPTRKFSWCIKKCPMYYGPDRNTLKSAAQVYGVLLVNCSRLRKLLSMMGASEEDSSSFPHLWIFQIQGTYTISTDGAWKKALRMETPMCESGWAKSPPANFSNYVYENSVFDRKPANFSSSENQRVKSTERLRPNYIFQGTETGRMNATVRRKVRSTVGIECPRETWWWTNTNLRYYLSALNLQKPAERTHCVVYFHNLFEHSAPPKCIYVEPCQVISVRNFRFAVSKNCTLPSQRRYNFVPIRVHAPGWSVLED